MNAPLKCHLTAIACDAVNAMYRFLVPMRALIESNFATGNVYINPIHEWHERNASALVLSVRATHAPNVAAAAKKDGCRLILDFDELLAASPSEIARLLADADEVTVATEPLAHELGLIGRRPTILPPTLDPRDWTAQPRRTERTRPRVGWYGGRRALGNVAELCDSVTRMLIDEVDFVFFDCVPPALHDYADRVECAPAIPLSLFAAQFAALDLDIVLTPLAHGRAAECSSHLPLLQAGILGYPVIATDIVPYAALPVCRVANVPAAWVAAVRERISDITACRSDGDMLRAAVEQSFLIQAWTDQYFERWTGCRVTGARA